MPLCRCLGLFVSAAALGPKSAASTSTVFGHAYEQGRLRDNRAERRPDSSVALNAGGAVMMRREKKPWDEWKQKIRKSVGRWKEAFGGKVDQTSGGISDRLPVIGASQAQTCCCTKRREKRNLAMGCNYRYVPPDHTIEPFVINEDGLYVSFSVERKVDKQGQGICFYDHPSGLDEVLRSESTERIEFEDLPRVGACPMQSMLHVDVEGTGEATFQDKNAHAKLFVEGCGFSPGGNCEHGTYKRDEGKCNQGLVLTCMGSLDSDENLLLQTKDRLAAEQASQASNTETNSPLLLLPERRKL